MSWARINRAGTTNARSSDRRMEAQKTNQRLIDRFATNMKVGSRVIYARHEAD